MIRVYVPKDESERPPAEPEIPLPLFKHSELGVLEVTVKCLRENFGLDYAEIADLLNRDRKTVWSSYQKAREKRKRIFRIEKPVKGVRCSVFRNRELGPLESLTVFMREELKMTFSQIAENLDRSYQTIWLSYQKGIKKIN